MQRARSWLMLAGSLSAAAALLHVACILGGPEWYRVFGAGEEMARAAELGSPYPAIVTTVIAAILGIWAAYAFAAAGLLGRLPLLRTVLVAVTLVYLARGLALIPLLLLVPAAATPFDIWSSLIVLGYGIVHAVGLGLAWPALRLKESY